MVDWAGAILAILRTVKREELKVDPKYIAIKPRVLSDDNILRGVSALRAVLAFIPPAAIGASVLSLGEMGFQIWKRIALNQSWDELQFPPMDPNIMRLSVELDPVLKKHFGHLIMQHNWDAAAISELEKSYNDFSFITSLELLQAKYPEIDAEYLKARALRNKDLLQTSIYAIEQSLVSVKQQAEVEANLQEALEALKTLVPAMRDWALFNSEGFNEIVDILDVVL